LILFKAVHEDYVEGWKDYEKTASFRNGARWNLAKTPVMYLSTNVQNAMLELANYSISVEAANTLYDIVVFDFPSLRLYEVKPEDLPANWNRVPFDHETQEQGDLFLTNHNYDGFVVPSVALCENIVKNPINEIRSSAYANVVINLEKVGLDKVEVLGRYKPVFSNRMFNQ